MRWELLRRHSEGSGSVNFARVMTHDIRYRPAFGTRYAWKTGCGDSGRSPGTTLLKPRSAASRGRWPAGSKSGETTIGALHSNCLILKTKEDDKAGDESSYSISPWSPRGIALWDSEKAEAVADNLEAQFQPVTDPSVPAVIEMVDVLLRSFFLSPASEPQLTNPDEVHEAIRGLKVWKAPGPNGIPNRALKHLAKRAVSILTYIFNAALRTHHFPQTWKHARVISIHKTGKDPALPSSYRPICLLDTIGKLFEKILLARIYM